MKEMLLQKKRAAKAKKKPRVEEDPAERVTATGDFQGFNLVYQHSRYDAHQPPICVYIPSPEMLFKLMRSSIGCHEPEDLWIYDKEDS